VAVNVAGRPLRAEVPALYGVHAEGATGRTWLVCDYLEETDLLHRKSAALAPAARWAGAFHRLSAAHLSQAPLSFVNAYTVEYYLGWARRTFRFAEGLHGRFPWLRRLCDRFEEAAAVLLTPPLPVIHGEYYPGNVLVRKGRIYPVDWESAAAAAGEIDLASLTECWSAAIARRCEAEYQRARWPEGAPADFGRRLAAARLYMAFRWLGERPDWTTDEAVAWRFDELRSAGEQFGLL
jgi:aminoglycoside phosphotransferase (APT) family kinase protein